MKHTDISPAQIRMAAMDCLARREHSEKELKAKLTKKFDSMEWIEQVVCKLKEDGLQSDMRFAEAFVSMRKRQGKGVKRIKLELLEKGISTEITNHCCSHLMSDSDWKTLAFNVYQKKYGLSPCNDAKERLKRIRFMASRGFSTDQIAYVMNAQEHEVFD